MCQIFGVVAWVMGNGYLESCRRTGRQPEQLAVAGRILWMISVGLLVLGIVAGVVFFALFGFAAVSIGPPR